MSKKEANNTFSKGMIQDLNPINTPNTVLTDCLNGTIITYDGNEFSLQNDKGNYALKNCKLSPNYIPVGIKEYGDILYIVSYNPLDKNVEIGSYPSPQTRFLGNPEKGSKSIEPLVNWDSGTSTNYSSITKKEKLNIFYDTDNPENSKLYPGDRYQLTINEFNENSPYETIKYYILDEEKKLTEISDLVEKCNSDTEYKYVAWNIPGWFSYKQQFAKINDVQLNYSKFILDGFTSDNNSSVDLILNLNFQVSSSDKLFNEWTLQEKGIPGEGLYLHITIIKRDTIVGSSP